MNVDGNEIKRKTIFVNSPAKYHGIDYYQTDWNIIGLRVKLKNSQNFQYPFINLSNTQEKVWLTWITSSEQLTNGITLLIDNLQGYCSVYNKFGTFIGNVELNENFELEKSLTLIEA